MGDCDDARIIRFGPFEADLETAELCKQGVRISLQIQPFQVLALLLNHAGELVTRDQLRFQIWPHDTFVDFDHALNTAITKIRVALGDNAQRPIFIETLPRRGYRFIGIVQTPDINAPTAGDAMAMSVPRKMLWIVVGVAVLLGTVMLWRTRSHHSDPSLRSLEVVPFVPLHGFQGHPAFSPDGNQVAFTRYEGEDDAIYTALIGGDTPLRLTTKSGVCCPTWSPDGRQIAFMRFSKKRIQHQRDFRHSEAPRKLCTHRNSRSSRDFQEECVITWIGLQTGNGWPSADPKTWITTH